MFPPVGARPESRLHAGAGSASAERSDFIGQGVCQFPKGIERIFPQDVTSFQHSSGPYGSRFPVVVNDCRCLSEHVVFFQHQAPCLTDGGEPFFIINDLKELAEKLNYIAEEE